MKSADPDVSRWVLEFLLRSSVPDSLMAKIIAVLPLSAADPRLKKTLLLRTLQSELFKASITETALEILEHVEQIDRNDAVPVPDAMRRAYCAVAVECTVKYLAGCPDDAAGEYFSSLNRIWRGRVAEAERRRSELFSDEMARWRDDVEAAVWDPRVSERLASLNSRSDAFKEVRVYLEEAWGAMGPSFLESLAMSSRRKKKKKKKGSGSLDAVPLRAVAAEGCTEGVGGIDSCAEPVRERGEREDLDGGDDSACCMEGVILNDGNHGKEQLEERGEGSVDGNQESAEGEKVSSLASQKGNLQHQRKQPALRRCRRAFKTSGAEELDPEISWSKYDPVASSKVKKTRESLKLSSLELRSLVKDPLPDALHTSEVVRSKLASKDANSEPPIENQNGHLDVPNSNMCRSIVLYQPIDAYLGMKSSVHSSNVQRPNLMERKSTAPNLGRRSAAPNLERRSAAPNIERRSAAPNLERRSTAPNLMERNGTAYRYEWDDSIENKPQGIPSRRKKRKWTSLEEETLITGVKMFGEGNWATIRSFYSNIFENRNGVDLKDKWRNMLR